jgi:hypothetical protein
VLQRRHARSKLLVPPSLSGLDSKRNGLVVVRYHLDWQGSGMETPSRAARLRRVLRRRLKCLFRSRARVKSETLIAVEAEYTCIRCGKVQALPRTSTAARTTPVRFLAWAHKTASPPEDHGIKLHRVAGRWWDGTVSVLVCVGAVHVFSVHVHRTGIGRTRPLRCCRLSSEILTASVWLTLSLSVVDCFAGQERSTICRCGERAIRHRCASGPLAIVYGNRLVAMGRGPHDADNSPTHDRGHPLRCRHGGRLGLRRGR